MTYQQPEKRPLMGLAPTPLVSVVIVNFNRRDDLAYTLDRLAESQYPNLEIIVVDNSSADDSVSMLRRCYPEVRVIPLTENLGTLGRNRGLEEAKGQYILMLDSDSHPEPQSISRMVEHFENHQDLGAAAFRTMLPDQSEEPAANDHVFIGCGAGFRKEALREIGGYPADYGFYVEEYDVSYRLIENGLKVRYFDDLIVNHRKSEVGRDFGQIIRQLVRNNLYLYTRYFPTKDAVRTLGWQLRRYYNLSSRNQVRREFYRGMAQGLRRALPAMAKPKLSPRTLDQVVPGRFCQKRIDDLKAEHNLAVIALWGIGKDFSPLVRAFRQAGLIIVGAYPGRLGNNAFHGRKKILGIPILPEDSISNLVADALVIASCSPGETRNEMARLKKIAAGQNVLPLYTLESFAGGADERVFRI